ncbi:MAG: TRIC cation channel family protein [Alphaproteobacteria bacterium]
MLIRFIVLLSLLSGALQASDDLRVGWYPWDPYQYIEDRNGIEVLTGLDAKLVKVIAKNAGLSVQFQRNTWGSFIDNLRTGKLDMAGGASYNAERAEHVYYSLPYRSEMNAVIVRREDGMRHTDIKTILETIKEQNLKVGIIQGYYYTEPEINDFIKDPANKDHIVSSYYDQDNFRMLLNGQIDAVFADRIVAATMIWRLGVGRSVREIPLPNKIPVHFVFSKKSTTPETVEKINEGITQLKSTGEYGQIINDYLFPLLLLQTIDEKWFLLIDLLGTIAFAISGLLVAYRERASLFGTFVIAALPAMGGGIMRDILVSRQPIAILSTPMYILAVLATVIIGFIIVKWIRAPFSTNQTRKLLDGLYTFADSLGLAAFTVIGVVVALMTKAGPLWLWGPLLAAITGAGGGILRDTFRSDKYIMALMGEVYAEIALLWGLLFSLFLIWQRDRMNPDEILYSVIAVIIGGTVTRMLVVKFNIKSPLFGHYVSVYNRSKEEQKSA